jgi:hypothetical protein
MKCENMNLWLEGKIDAYTYLIKNGKPASIIAVQTRYVPETVKLIEKQDLLWLEEYLADGWSDIWIFKEPLMKKIIKSLPDKPKSAYDHWVLGKVFGYSDTEIFSFIRKQKELN